MAIRILSAADVRTALPMPKAIDAMRHAYSQLSAGKATAPPRQHISTDNGGYAYNARLSSRTQ